MTVEAGELARRGAHEVAEAAAALSPRGLALVALLVVVIALGLLWSTRLRGD